jgi:tRNA threonylcarbamoyladenosine biosynthesis protein TsaE
MQEHTIIFTEEIIDQAASEFLSVINDYKHLAFYGEMGAGKTTFIKALCNIIGTSDLVASPTFAIINEYVTFTNARIYHFDFYRIKTSAELLDIGFYEYCNPDAYCFIEWPEKASGIIPEDFISIMITVMQDGSRKLSFAL